MKNILQLTPFANKLLLNSAKLALINEIMEAISNPNVAIVEIQSVLTFTEMGEFEGYEMPLHFPNVW